MPVTPWHRRFEHTTRGRLVALLRRDASTVEELAQHLQLTDNAVRAHLVALERDGWVVQHGERRGGSSGKPAYVYELTAGAEALFPKAYGLITLRLLDILDEQMSPEDVTATLRQVGRRIAPEHRPAAGDLRTRLEAAARAINDLGGLAEVAEVAERPGTYSIRSHRCMLADIVVDHPEACQLAGALVTEMTGEPVQERCERGAQPRCRFDASSTSD
jgi:predicted ArsR family transcriptional regulator